MAGPTPSLFVSYSHDSDSHRASVGALVDVLRASGIRVVCDLGGNPPPEGWDVWAMREMSSATAIVVMMSADYRRFFEGGPSGAVGRGIAWEAAVLRSLIYRGALRDRVFLMCSGLDDPVAVTPTGLPVVQVWRFPDDQDGLVAALAIVFADARPPRRVETLRILARAYARYSALLSVPLLALLLWRNVGDQLAEVALSTWTHPLTGGGAVVVALPPYAGPADVVRWRRAAATLLDALDRCRPDVLVLDADIRGNPQESPELARSLSSLVHSRDIAFIQAFDAAVGQGPALAGSDARLGDPSLDDVFSVVVGVDVNPVHDRWPLDIAALAAPGMPHLADDRITTAHASVHAPGGLVLAPLPASIQVIPWQAAPEAPGCPPHLAAVTGRVAYVGAVDSDADVKPTPRGKRPGVEVHAGIYQALLHDAEIRTLSPAWDVAASGGAITATFATRRLWRQPRLAGRVIGLVWLAGVVLLGTIGGLWLGLTPVVCFLGIWSLVSWKGGR